MVRRLVFTYLTLVLLVLVALAVPLGYLYQRSEHQQTFRQLERETAVLAAQVSAAPARIEDLAAEPARRWAGLVEVFDSSGQLLFSTQPGGTGVAPDADQANDYGFTRAGGVPMMSVTVAFPPGRDTAGAVRLSSPTAPIDEAVYQFWALLAAACAVVLAISAAVAVGLATWIARPVRALESATRQLADGDTEPAAVRLGGPPELRRLAETFNRTAQRLHTVLAARGSFVEHASHQLKSPLAALRLRLENLEPDVAPDGTENLEAALGETDRLDRMVNTLLDLTLIERREEQPEPVDVAAEAVERAAIWQPLAAERAVTVHADVSGSVWALTAPGMIEQILDNLISNALQVAPTGSVIRLSAAPVSGGRIELHVADTGPGLPPEERERAFDPFWRAPGAPRGGTGLGLTLVRKLAEADGGQVRLDPVMPSGNDAVVTLPAVPRIAV
jgi:signal transduction histidine kinase